MMAINTVDGSAMCDASPKVSQESLLTNEDLERRFAPLVTSTPSYRYSLTIETIKLGSAVGAVPAESAVLAAFPELVRRASRGVFPTSLILGDLAELARSEHDQGLHWVRAIAHYKVAVSPQARMQEWTDSPVSPLTWRLDDTLTLWCRRSPATLAVYNRLDSVLVYDLQRLCPLLPQYPYRLSEFVSLGHWRQLQSDTIGERPLCTIVSYEDSNDQTRLKAISFSDDIVPIPIGVFTGSVVGRSTIFLPRFTVASAQAPGVRLLGVARLDFSQVQGQEESSMSFWSLADLENPQDTDLLLHVPEGTELLDGRIGSVLTPLGSRWEAWPPEVLKRVGVSLRKETTHAATTRWIVVTGVLLLVISVAMSIILRKHQLETPTVN